MIFCLTKVLANCRIFFSLSCLRSDGSFQALASGLCSVVSLSSEWESEPRQKRRYDHDAIAKTHCRKLKRVLTGSLQAIDQTMNSLKPHYKRDGYILKVACRNSVDKKYALTINLSVLPAGAIRNI